YPVVTTSLLIVDAQFDPDGPRANGWGDRFSATCDAGVPLGDGEQYGRVPGGEIIDCEGAEKNSTKLLGRFFYSYRFSVGPGLSLLNNILTLTLLIDGAYGKWSNTGKCCYNNDWINRTWHEPIPMAEIRYDGTYWRGSSGNGGFGNSKLYPADFWKLREIGLRYTLPEPLVSRIGAASASLALSAREVATLWLRQSETSRGFDEVGRRIGGMSVPDPEMAGGTGSSATGYGTSGFRTLPPNTNLSATLRVIF